MQKLAEILLKTKTKDFYWESIRFLVKFLFYLISKPSTGRKIFSCGRKTPAKRALGSLGLDSDQKVADTYSSIPEQAMRDCVFR